MIPLPTPSTDPVLLADWLELNAVISNDNNYSLGDLRSVLKRAAVLAADNQDLESKTADVSFEINYRLHAAGSGYPFAFDGDVLESDGSWEGYPAYVFCLCLSFFEWETQRRGKPFPARLFEKLSCFTAETFLYGHSIRFAAPRERPIPKSFRAAVSYTCQQVGEGVGLSPRAGRVGQDDTLDVVAWRDFPDQRRGKLILFGQCAAGRNWRSKLSDLQPPDFCQLWMEEAPTSTLLKSLFIPYRVPDPLWRVVSTKTKMIFDRCRIAYWAAQAGAPMAHAEQYVEWADSRLRRYRR